MTSRLRLILLVLVLAWVTVVGPGTAAGAPRRTADSPWFASRLLDLGRLRAHAVKRPAPKPAPAPSLGDRAARYARRLLGVPYRYGRGSPTGSVDWSGLVRVGYGHFGRELRLRSSAVFNRGRIMWRGALRPGGLLFSGGLG